MDSEILIARLALAKGLISAEAYRAILDRSSEPGMVEDSLRGAGLSSEQLSNLRGALQIKKQEVRVGDWTLLRRIGIGGMGSVFEVRHRRTGRRAALKILLPRLGRDPEFTLRFLQEARALARISHPNVVHAYDAGKSGEFHFIAMELVEGEDLQRVLERVGCLAPVRSVEIMLEVTRGLQAIQMAGLIHRDVKPANILLDAAGAVKLTDLGLFHDDLEREVLWDGTVFGTPQYMSPEQVLGSPKIDIRSDLYSLGATWYHTLIGRPMFPKSTLGKVARAQVEAMPVPPRDIRPDVPLAIDRLILHLLEKDPERRPEGPEEVIISLEGILASLGLLKKAALMPNGRFPGLEASPAGDRSGRSRRRLLIASGALAGILVLALLVWAGRALFRPGPADLGKILETPGPSAATPGDQRAAAAALASASELVSMVDSSSRRVLDRALPAIPSWLSLKSGPGDDPGRRPAPAGEQVPALPALPEGVLAWAVEGAMEARERFLAALATWPGPLPIEVVLRTGEVVKAQVPGASTRERALELADGRPIPLAALHPASVIAWAAALAPDKPILDRGAGLSVREGFLPGARMVLEAFAPPLPHAARAFILSGAEGLGQSLAGLPPLSIETTTGNLPGSPPPPSAAAEAFLARSLRDSRQEWAARNSLRSGRYLEAAGALAALLSSEPTSPQAEVRRAEWIRLRDRAERLSFTTGKFFAPGGSPLDPFRGEEVIVRYPFDGDPELRDFRFEPRSWSLEEGALRRAAFGPGAGRRPSAAGTPDRKRADFLSAVDTVALFAPPVTVRGTWTNPRDRESRIAVGFAGRFAVLGPGSVLATWQGELEDGRLPEPAGRAAPAGGGAEKVTGRFQVEFLADGAFAQFPGGERVSIQFPPAALPALPPPGRIAIGLEPGVALESLEITGTPDPAWTEARIEELKKRESR